MLFPKKLKYQKVHKGRIKGVETKANNPKLGVYGIKSVDLGRLSSQQIECARKSISRKMSKSSLIRLKIFPSVPVTSKPAEVRMGKGKGDLRYWCAPIKSGRLLFEFYCISIALAVDIHKIVSSKLPIKTKLIKYL